MSTIGCLHPGRNAGQKTTPAEHPALAVNIAEAHIAEILKETLHFRWFSLPCHHAALLTLTIQMPLLVHVFRSLVCAAELFN
jgi:hypothetical protein